MCVDEEFFYFSDPKNEITTLALWSLKTALEAYFATFNRVESLWHDIINPVSEQGEEDVLDMNYRRLNYPELYVEAIVHFQHFAELFCVDILRSEHPLLFIDINSETRKKYGLNKKNKHEHIDVYDEIKNVPKDLSTDDYVGEDTINFNLAVSRIYTLVKERNMGNETLNFFDENIKKSLSELVKKRNHLMHRGVMILRYKEFDQFVIRNIFPFVKGVMSLAPYARRSRLWKYKELACQDLNGDKVDPLNMILESGQTNYEPAKVAFLKEMARAAYQNPLPEQIQMKGSFSSDDRMIKPRLEEEARAIVSNYGDASIQHCPVCGAYTLIVYWEIESDHPIEPTTMWRNLTAIRCVCCSFSPKVSLGNPRDYGIDIDNFGTAD